jgi:hypothetical protein
VLDQVVPPWAIIPRRRDQPGDRVQLVVARKDQRLAPPLLARLRIFPGLDLQVDEAGENVEPAIPRPDFFPEVRRLVASGLSGLPAPRSRPRLNGRNRVAARSRRVVM